jgi:ubiquinone/menaquinone biosynthesis C-methylase UbiE
MPSTSNQPTYIDTMIQNLEQANPLREPTLRSISAALNFTPGSHGLDIGCGIGLQTLLLAEATSPGGHVTGLDISAELLAYARNRIKASSLSDQISFKEGDWQNLPFPDNTFDWAWSADCVGYPSGDLPAALKEIIRVLQPGPRNRFCRGIRCWKRSSMPPVLRTSRCSGARPQSHTSCVPSAGFRKLV